MTYMKHYMMNIKEETIEYVIKKKERKDGTEYVLKNSKSEIWNEHSKGEVQVSIFDNGNDYVIKITDYSDIVIDASDLCNLRMILNYLADDNTNLTPEFIKLKIDE